MRILILMTALLLAGCAAPKPVFWQFPEGGTEEEYARDRTECLATTPRQQVYGSPAGGGLAAVFAYQANVDAAGQRYSALFNRCMYAKKYSIIPRETYEKLKNKEPQEK